MCDAGQNSSDLGLNVAVVGMPVRPPDSAPSLQARAPASQLLAGTCTVTVSTLLCYSLFVYPDRCNELLKGRSFCLVLYYIDKCLLNKD